jgi:hypothetical protein
VDGLTQRALRLLHEPGQYRPLGAPARARVLQRYELGRCRRELVQFLQGLRRADPVGAVFSALGGK